MKIDLNSYSDVDVVVTTEDKEMTLSKDSTSIIFQIFSKNIYSNPIGSIVREITSNCFDSHIEANVNAPVVIRKHQDKQTGTYYISFFDFGVGMSPDRINKVFSVYFESTKRTNNEQIGGFGLGSKSPLAYKRSTGYGEGEYDNSYNIITNYNGVRYTYLIHEGKKCPHITLMDYNTTTENNGTEVQIPVLEKDINSFQNEMLKQLYYFENIIFEGFEYEDSYSKEMIYPMSNDYQIINGKSFLFRGTDYSKNIHICLGKVAYPIDYDVLGLESFDYQLSIALKLNVGDVNVTASRESIDYGEATIKMLKNKLEVAKAEIIGLISKQYENTKTLEQYFSVKNDFGKLLFKNGATLYVGNLIKQKDVDFSNFKYQFMKMPNSKQLFKFFFESKMYGKKPSRYGSDLNFDGGYNELKTKDNLLYVDDNFNRKNIKQAWLKDTFNTYYIIDKRVITGDWIKSEIADLFNVHLDNIFTAKGNPVAFVKSLLKMQEEYMEIIHNNTENYETLVIPEDFVASRKRNAGITSELCKKTIPVNFMCNYSRDRIKLSELFNYKMPIFYGTKDDEYKLKETVRLYGILFKNHGIITHYNYDDKLISNISNKSSIIFIQIASNNVKYMKYCKNAHHINEFNIRMLYRKEETIYQYFQMRKAIEKYDKLENFYKNGFIDKISTIWGTKIQKISLYIENMPELSKDDSINYQKSILIKYFKLDDIKPTAEQKVIIDEIDEVLALQEKNEKTLGYFNMPYDMEDFEEEQITLLQLAMKF